ncbi:MAG: bifunctional UDP-N-acetylglucosamine diphosphorylase/glucosamine-1-phosphate N-acetyltransferase GlmU [Planctomycetes bacterium]|nr:bifunctional UDP-N-acetylglucosamine diphosphorylase/glucosamine-1-phosphate N-acetyltransferase GlmU [Planctomycetota bacterium]
MADAPLAVLLLAAGKGTRAKVSLPKVLLPLCGGTLLDYALDAAGGLEPHHVVTVVHHGMEQITKRLGERFEEEGIIVVDQGEPLGTGHAVQRALDGLDRKLGHEFEGNVLVLYGDTPLITRDSLLDVVETLELPPEPGTRSGQNGNPKGSIVASLLTCQEMAQEGLGRILRDQHGCFVAIREERDCSDEELEIQEVNTGICAFRSSALRQALPSLKSDNTQGEYYLTDVFGWLVAEGENVEAVPTFDPDEVLGINDLDQLAHARWVMQDRLLLSHLLNGVLIEDPATTVIERDVQIGAETTILPFVVIRNGARIGRGCEVGPFTHLRVGAQLEDGAEVGNFVEMKNSTLGSGSKAKHLTYLGDTVIGKKTNIGAGTITANYDGTAKHKTGIGDGVFIGSGAVLIAPMTVGDRASTGAGAIVTKDVPEGEVWIGVPARKLRDKEGT